MAWAPSATMVCTTLSLTIQSLIIMNPITQPPIIIMPRPISMLATDMDMSMVTNIITPLITTCLIMDLDISLVDLDPLMEDLDPLLMDLVHLLEDLDPLMMDSLEALHP